MYTIYKIVNTINNKVYIGYTSKDLLLRLSRHFYEAQWRKNKTKWHRAIIKYGDASFSIMTLEETEDLEKAHELEKFYIKSYNSIIDGYNTHEGGLGGKTRTQEQLEYLSNSMIGNTYYKNVSKEGKNRSIDALRKYNQSEQGIALRKIHSERIANLNKGKPMNQETIDKIRATKLANPTDTRHTAFTLTSPTGEIYSCFGVRELEFLCKNLGISFWAIQRHKHLSNPKSSVYRWQVKRNNCNEEGNMG